MKRFFLLSLASTLYFFTSAQNAKTASTVWQLYVDSASAFQISLPQEPNIKWQKTPTPDIENAITLQKLGFSLDPETKMNYLFVVSDLPIGYYLEDPNTGFDGLLERFSTKGEVLTDTEIIFKDGVEGRYFEGLINGSYFVRNWFYIRGSRSYYFLQQSNTKKPIKGDAFIESLQFLPLKAPEFFSTTEANFVFSRFSRHNSNEEPGIAYIKKYTTINSQNPNSGAAYIAEIAQLSPYFYVENLDSFYTTFADDLTDWSDTVISINNITVDGQPGREMWINNYLTGQDYRLRFWVNNSNLVTIYSYASPEEQHSKTEELFFNGFHRAENAPTFNIYSSKSKMLLADLSAADSTIKYDAHSALASYDFDSSDLPLMYTELAKSWPDDSTDSGVRGTLIAQIKSIAHKSSLPVLAEFYTDKSHPTILRNEALIATKNFGDSNLTTYFELFLKNPPDSISYFYQYFSPFTDSLSFAATNFNRFLPMLDDEKLSNGVLNLATELMRKDSSTYYNVVFEALPVLTKDAVSKATELRDSSKTNEYFYSTEVTNFVSLLNYFPNNSLIEVFTTPLMDTAIDSYQVASAIGLRLKGDLNVPKTSLDFCFDEKYSRYTIMKECFESGNTQLIPKKYSTAEAVAEILFSEFLSEDEGYPDKVKILGQIKENGQTYYALQASFEWDEDVNYLGVCGPIDSKKPLAALTTARTNSTWDLAEKDWKAQATQLISTLAEEGWPWY